MTSTDQAHFDGARIAIVHEWLSAKAGSELVFMELARSFPNADLYALTSTPGIEFSPDDRPITTTFLQHNSVLRDRRSITLGLMPVAWATIKRQREYDLVITSAHAFAREFPLNGAKHLSYVHAPMRYAWTPELDGRTQRSTPFHAAARRLLQKRDLHSVPTVDSFLANSTEIAQRIQTFYHRDAEVVPPPVPMEDLLGLQPRREGYVLALSRWISYKRLDLAIEACALLKIPLVVAGSGPEASNLKKLASRLGADTRFVNQPSREELGLLMAGADVFVFPAHEDFGIVAIEAQAAGLPVVGLGAGGSLDTIRDGETGTHASEQSPPAFAAAIQRCLDLRIPPNVCRIHAEQFSAKGFQTRIRDAASRLLGEQEHSPDAATRADTSQSAAEIQQRADLANYQTGEPHD